MTYNTISEVICKSFVIRLLLNLDHFVCPFTAEGAAYPNVFRPICEPEPRRGKNCLIDVHYIDSESFDLFVLDGDCLNNLFFIFFSTLTQNTGCSWKSEIKK